MGGDVDAEKPSSAREHVEALRATAVCGRVRGDVTTGQVAKQLASAVMTPE